ncbi:hypothetical protein GPECTOR_2g1584 [Gonium pectorale]|uniref:Guanylate cyclase domain-containing protein n=1 Tax=Gonium pectorale TaxID=33097 RepID=A0A150H245_GONPE|nr:hypothetical protein GPECTOR_2g1584 [Gonium pectorale]|eukprot:KXZ56032.1 hypothetical protein GPECTOR_2g1584 [Gonium pectorale]
MVLLSSATLEQLARPGGGSAPAPAPASRDVAHLLLHMGLHVTKAGPDPVALYMAESRELLPRLALLGPQPSDWVRSSEQLEPAVLDAPMGEVTLAAVTVVGLPTLMAWDKAVTEEALATFRRVAVTDCLWRVGGHLVEEGQGRLLAAFGHPYDAIRWVTTCEPALKAADWSTALLEHELAEEVAAGGSGPGSAEGGEAASGRHMADDGADPDPSRLVFRGLRIKAAVDCGSVRSDLQPSTGRMTYRGGLGGAVQRIIAHITTGQVVCTSRAWHGYTAAAELLASTGSPPPPEGDVAAAPLGVRSLRGARDKVELWSVWLEAGDLDGSEAGSLFGSQELVFRGGAQLLSEAAGP